MWVGICLGWELVWVFWLWNWGLFVFWYWVVWLVGYIFCWVFFLVYWVCLGFLCLGFCWLLWGMGILCFSWVFYNLVILGNLLWWKNLLLNRLLFVVGLVERGYWLVICLFGYLFWLNCCYWVLGRVYRRCECWRIFVGKCFWNGGWYMFVKGWVIVLWCC